MEFEDQLIELLKERLECSQGDAQGILEAHNWEVLTSEQRGHTPEECIERILGPKNEKA